MEVSLAGSGGVPTRTPGRLCDAPHRLSPASARPLTPSLPRPCDDEQVQQGEGGRLWRSWMQYGQHGMVLLYLIVMMRSDLLMDLPPLPPPALTDRHVLLTSIQLGTRKLLRRAAYTILTHLCCGGPATHGVVLCVRAAPRRKLGSLLRP